MLLGVHNGLDDTGRIFDSSIFNSLLSNMMSCFLFGNGLTCFGLFIAV
jgi:hypothetical protein